MGVFLWNFLFVCSTLFEFGNAGCTFERFPGQALYGFNTRVLKNMEIWECEKECLEEESFDCISFDYGTNKQTCFLSSEDRHIQPGAYGKHLNSDYYEKVCGDDVDVGSGSGSDDNDCERDMVAYDGHCYKFFTSYDKTWESAQETCMGNGGHLAVVEDEREFAFLKREILRVSGHTDFELFWIGGVKHDGDWVWDMGDGEYWPLEYENWYPGEPNNDRNRENVMNILFKDSSWGFNDAYENDRLRYICEYDY